MELATYVIGLGLLALIIMKIERKIYPRKIELTGLKDTYIHYENGQIVRMVTKERGES